MQMAEVPGVFALIPKISFLIPNTCLKITRLFRDKKTFSGALLMF